MTRYVPRVFIECIKSNLFIEVYKVPVKDIAEALLIRTSIPPNFSTPFLTASSTDYSSLISHFNGKAYPPAASISLAAV